MSIHFVRHADPKNIDEVRRLISMLCPTGPVGNGVPALIAVYRTSGDWATTLKAISGAVAATEPLKSDPSREARHLRRELLDLLQAGIGPRYPVMASQITIILEEPRRRRSRRALSLAGVTAFITACAALLGALSSLRVQPW